MFYSIVLLLSYCPPGIQNEMCLHSLLNTPVDADCILFVVYANGIFYGYHLTVEKQHNKKSYLSFDNKRAGI